MIAAMSLTSVITFLVNAFLQLRRAYKLSVVPMALSLR